MDVPARRRLVDLLASLPSGTEREFICEELGGGATPPNQRKTPESHAEAVVEQLLESGADLPQLFDLLRERHAALRGRIDRVAELLLEPQVAGDEGAESPTELIDASALAGLADAHRPKAPVQLGQPRNLAEAETAEAAEAEATDEVFPDRVEDAHTEEGPALAVEDAQTEEAPASEADEATARTTPVRPPPPAFSGASRRSSSAGPQVVALVSVLVLIGLLVAYFMTAG